MKKLYNFIIIILVATAICIVAMIIYRHFENAKNETQLKDVLIQLKHDVEESKDEVEAPYIEYQGYQVIGTIIISKIDLEYPILNVSNEDAMRKSIIKFWGEKVNGIGNLTLARTQ